MYLQVNSKRWRLVAFVTLVLVLWQLFTPLGVSAGNIKLVIDGRKIDASPLPLIQNGRTLVPVRLVAEELNAQVDWDEENRIVHIVKGDRAVVLRIDSRLVEYNVGTEKIFGLADVPSQIFDGRTFVPIRLVSNALGVGIAWDDASRTVSVDSAQTADITPFFAMKIASVEPGQVISGTTELCASFPEEFPAGAAEIRYLLLNPETGRGRVVTRGNKLNAAYRWLPDLKEQGERVLVAAVYDGEGKFLAGDAVSVEMAVTPMVSLTGVAPGQVIKDTVSLGAALNFMPAYVKYTIVNQDKDKVFVSAESDPQGAYNWAPQVEDNGNVSLQVIAYDHMGQAYESPIVTTEVAVPRRLELRGVNAGSTIEKPVTLLAGRNFPVSETEYVLRDPQTGNEEIIAKIPYGGYRWFPGPEQAGMKEVLVRVKDTTGTIHTSGGIRVNITANPLLILEGVGPQQVVTGPVQLKAVSNVELANIQYILLNPQTGAKKVVAAGDKPAGEYTWAPASDDEGERIIQALATTASGTTVTSEAIPFRVYLGEIYTAKPVVEKSEFLNLASGLASQSWKKTGMSAALQTAQAILETGWGQSVPVDKYTGKFSNNLFGIKGEGPAGSVISNTWEEYNGQTFHIDAAFRAYNNVSESWADHKQFLLTGKRYEPFRAVMHDSAQGAWALKRAGYATDSKYPLKLMDIINRYELHKLDEVSI
ncbi:MAG: glucosaminidase domain-containing protein [bacterium]|jgi:hypothetical protein